MKNPCRDGKQQVTQGKILKILLYVDLATITMAPSSSLQGQQKMDMKAIDMDMERWEDVDSSQWRRYLQRGENTATQTLIAIETLTHSWACTNITDAWLPSEAETTLWA